MKLFNAEIVKVKSELPTVAPPGETDMFAAGVLGVPACPGGEGLSVSPPQPNCEKRMLRTIKNDAQLTILIQTLRGSSEGINSSEFILLAERILVLLEFVPKLDLNMVLIPNCESYSN